ncbi:MAG: glycosyltransferase [Pseudomonadota bacterium]
MPCRDAAATIEQALRSALSQSVAALEIVVADGGSGDATRKIAQGFNGIRVLDGDDDGLYEGLNRAIAAARGEFVLLLNADDELPTGTLDTYQAAIAREPQCDLWTGSARFHGALALQLMPSVPMTPASTLHGIPSINSRLYRRRLLQAMPFEQDWGFAADRAFIHRIACSQVRRGRVDTDTYIYHAHDGSTTLDQSEKTRARVRYAERELAAAMTERVNGNATSGLDARAVHGFRVAQQLKAIRNADRPSLSFADLMVAPRAIRDWRRYRGQMCGW